MPNKLFIYLVLFLNFSIAKGQYINEYFEEVGIMAGPSFFQSDYGQRDVFKNYIKNNGFSITAAYYVTPHIENRFVTRNLKLRLDLSFMKADLKHYGAYVDEAKTSLIANQLRGMRGSVSTSSIGFQIEYFPLETDDYNRGYKLSPYIALGSHLVNYHSKAWSELGTLGSPLVTPVKYIDAYRNASNVTGAISASVGTRYVFPDRSALLLELKSQYYFTDWVDGLNPNRTIYTENKSNDWMSSLSIGYIYYFEVR